MKAPVLAPILARAGFPTKARGIAPVHGSMGRPLENGSYAGTCHGSLVLRFQPRLIARILLRLSLSVRFRPQSRPDGGGTSEPRSSWTNLQWANSPPSKRPKTPHAQQPPPGNQATRNPASQSPGKPATSQKLNNRPPKLPALSVSVVSSVSCVSPCHSCLAESEVGISVLQCSTTLFLHCACEVCRCPSFCLVLIAPTFEWSAGCVRIPTLDGTAQPLWPVSVVKKFHFSEEKMVSESEKLRDDPTCNAGH